MEQELEKKTDTRIPDMIHLDNLRKLKSIHPIINTVLKEYIMILERHIDPIKESMQNVRKSRIRMTEETSDEYYGEFYSNIPLIKDIIPNYRDAQMDFNTKVERQKADLIKFIIDLVDTTNKIQEKITEKPPLEEIQMSEADIKAFENKQREDMMAMTKATNKAEHNMIRNNIRKRAGDDEEKKTYTDNISREIFGMKIGDVEWKIGKRKTKS